MRDYVIGWGESGPYEQTDTVPSEAKFYRIANLGELNQINITISSIVVNFGINFLYSSLKTYYRF